MPREPHVPYHPTPGRPHRFSPILRSPDFFLRFYLFTYLLLDKGKRREKERERNIDVREEHQLVASYSCPQVGTEPMTQARALTRNHRTSDLLLCGTTPNQLSHTGPGCNHLILKPYLCTTPNTLLINKFKFYNLKLAF